MSTESGPRKSQDRTETIQSVSKLICVDLTIAAFIFIPIGIYVPDNRFQTAVLALLSFTASTCFSVLLELHFFRSFATNQHQTTLEALLRDRHLHERFDESPELAKAINNVMEKMDFVYEDSKIDKHSLISKVIYPEILTKLSYYCDDIHESYNTHMLVAKGDDCLRIATNCLNETTESVFAISYASPGFWTANSTSEFLAANFAALRRGVDITRIFAFNDTSSLKDAKFLESVMLPQMDMKSPKNKKSIDVRICLIGQFPEIPIRDMGLFDNRVTSYWAFPDDGQRPYESVIHWDRKSVEEARRLSAHMDSRTQQVGSIAQIKELVRQWEAMAVAK